MKELRSINEKIGKKIPFIFATSTVLTSCSLPNETKIELGFGLICGLPVLYFIILPFILTGINNARIANSHPDNSDSYTGDINSGS